MDDRESRGAALRIVICSAWPLIVPVLWWSLMIRRMRDSQPYLPGLREVTSKVASDMTGIAVRYGIVLFLLSLVTCVLVTKRSRAGFPGWRLAVEIATAAIGLWAVLVIPKVVLEGMDLSQLIPRPTNLFPVWAVSAAGLSLLAAKRLGQERVAA